MTAGKSTISQASSYEEMGEYWDHHDAGEVWDQTKPAEFDVDIRRERTYYSIGRALSEKLVQIARGQGISAETLLNLWIQEKILEAAQTK